MTFPESLSWFRSADESLVDDGMNGRGLVTSLPYLAELDFGKIVINVA